MSDTSNPILERWSKIFLIIVAVTIGFAAFMVLPPYPSIAYFNTLLYKDIGFPSDFSPEAIRYITFLYGVLGCVMIGWMALVAGLTHQSLSKGSARTWKLIMASLLIWFIPDTLLSLVSGYWQNGASNTVFFVAFLIPMLKMRAHLLT